MPPLTFPFMRIILSPSESPTVLAVVCCQHGNERFGLTVFKHFAAHLDRYPGLKVILANEPAVERNVRFLKTDLNRSFPGFAYGTHESRLAYEILSELAGIPYVLDIHTTTSDLSFVPIVTSLNAQVRQMLRLTSSREVAFIEPPLAEKSLIGNVSAGVSLEFGNAYALRLDALVQTIHIVDGILSASFSPAKERDVYHIAGGIPKSTSIPNDAENFKRIDSLGVYPILLHEAAYVDLHALAATRKETMVV